MIPGPNALTLGMDPDRLSADLALNGAGDPFCLEPARWELHLAPQELSAYARLLLDVMDGDGRHRPMGTYRAGSDGPTSGIPFDPPPSAG